MIVVVAGTRTEVGKTWYSAEILRELRRRTVSVAARKPAQSFDASDATPHDSEVLGAASCEPEDLVCKPHRNYEIAMAPPMASDALGLPKFTIADLFDELDLPGDYATVTLIETAGGVRSPIAHDGDTTHLCKVLQPALVILVADADLGTINAVRLCTEALTQHLLLVALNRFDIDNHMHRANFAWLVENDKFAVVTTPVAAVDAMAELLTDLEVNPAQP